MDWQWMANGMFAVCGVLLGILYTNVRKDIEKQDEVLTILTDKVQAIEVLVAGNYVHKNDLQNVTEALFKKLDMIFDKLDRKADKH